MGPARLRELSKSGEVLVAYTDRLRPRHSELAAAEVIGSDSAVIRVVKSANSKVCHGMGPARLREVAVSGIATALVVIIIPYANRLGHRDVELAADEGIRSVAAVIVYVAPDGKGWNGMASACLRKTADSGACPGRSSRSSSR